MSQARRLSSAFRALTVLLAAAVTASAAAKLEDIRLSPDGRGFVFARSGDSFIPWGLNYGRDGLIEDYWDSNWALVAKDFQEMKAAGANVARVHLQFGKFMTAPDRPGRKSLDRLARLVRLAEDTGLYLDLTGLGCYRKADVPCWYDALSESNRWAAQAKFWDAVSERCKGSSAIFCYDLMNEPVVSGEPRKAGDWYSGKLFGGYDFVQFITLDPDGRARDVVARAWIERLSKAIRKHDRRHLITVGLLPWTLKLGHLSGFVPKTVAPQLDFLSVHIYPERGKVPEALSSLEHFMVGKAVVIEETFPLYCSAREVEDFLEQSRGKANGWMGHYAGKTAKELDALKTSGKITPGQQIYLNWLELFKKLKPIMLSPAGADGS